MSRPDANPTFETLAAAGAVPDAYKGLKALSQQKFAGKPVAEARLAATSPPRRLPPQPSKPVSSMSGSIEGWQIYAVLRRWTELGAKPGWGKPRVGGATTFG